MISVCEGAWNKKTVRQFRKPKDMVTVFKRCGLISMGPLTRAVCGCCWTTSWFGWLDHVLIGPFRFR
jgi:hypothetical protein